jgi:tyrosinase
VDRVFAIWQTLNPTSWFNCSDEQLSYNEGNWYIPPGAIDTPETFLAPFHADRNGAHFTSDSVRDWMKLGYTYPELEPWLPKYHVHGLFSEVAYRRHLASYVNSLYSSVRTLVLDSPHTRDQVFEKRTAVIEHFDYVVNIAYDR